MFIGHLPVGLHLPQFNLPRNFVHSVRKSIFYRCEDGIRGVELCVQLQKQKAQ